MGCIPYPCGGNSVIMVLVINHLKQAQIMIMLVHNSIKTRIQITKLKDNICIDFYSSSIRNRRRYMCDTTANNALCCKGVCCSKEGTSFAPRRETTHFVMITINGNRSINTCSIIIYNLYEDFHNTHKNNNYYGIFIILIKRIKLDQR
jgi:hypothetical protein